MGRMSERECGERERGWKEIERKDRLRENVQRERERERVMYLEILEFAENFKCTLV